jgi:DNA-binding Lrp family transcriptional regulator
MQTKKEKVNLDEKDYKLLSSLAKNGRTRIIDLVEELKMDESTIRHRIKKLLKCQVIINFYARTNKHRIGLNTYIILLKTKKKLSDKEIKEIQKLRNLFYLKECGGKYNILARFHTSNNKELITTLNKIRQTFGENLSNYEVFTLLERRKFIPF